VRPQQGRLPPKMGLKTRDSLESSPQMSAHLKDAEGKRHEIGASCVLGRMPDCSIQLAGTRVSRRHALVHSMDGVQHWVVDLGSTNGVLVNGHRIQQPQALRTGDEIRVGDNRLVFHADSPQQDALDTLEHQLKTARAEAEVSALNYGIVVVGANGRPQFSTARAREWLVVYFPQTRRDSLPDEMLRWLKQRAGSPAGSCPPLIVAQDNRRLLVRMTERGGDEVILTLTEESPASLKALVERLGLTEREAEVLHWVVEGKSNSEAAIILDISVRTVDKHLQNVFSKLGVENRSAALRVVMFALGR